MHIYDKAATEKRIKYTASNWQLFYKKFGTLLSVKTVQKCRNM